MRPRYLHCRPSSNVTSFMRGCVSPSGSSLRVLYT
jgi:hypothetical protein